MSIPDYKGHTISLDGTEFVAVIDGQKRRSESYSGIKASIDACLRKVSVPVLRCRASRDIGYEAHGCINNGNPPRLSLRSIAYEITIDSISQDGTKVNSGQGAERIEMFYDPADTEAITAVLSADFDKRVVVEQVRKAALDCLDAELKEDMKRFKNIDAAWLRGSGLS